MNLHLCAYPQAPKFNTRIMCFLSTLGPQKKHLDARNHWGFPKMETGPVKKWTKHDTLQLWPWLPVTTGDFNGIIHSTNGVLLVLITGHNCGNMSSSESMVPQNIQTSHITNNIYSNI